MLAIRVIGFTAAYLASALGFTPVGAADESSALVVENSTQDIPEGNIRADLLGVRTITSSPVFLESQPSGVTLPKDVVVSAVRISGLSALLRLPKDNVYTFTDITIAAHSVDPLKVSWQPSNQQISNVYCGFSKTKLASSGDLSCDASATYNSEAILQLLFKGGLDTQNNITTEVGGKEIEFVGVRPSFAGVILASSGGMSAIAKTLNTQGPSSSSDIAQRFESIIQNSTKNEVIRSVAFLHDNYVTFGTPLIETSAEARLKVPHEIAANFDVYLIQLAMTWRQLPLVDLTEMGYSVTVPADTVALALMPLRYGITVEEKTGVHASPAIEVKDAKIELGEVYGRDISFSYLKPTIQAYGLQENKFSWTMRDQAIQPGAERFLCVIGVPKRSKELTLAMSAFARRAEGMFSVGGIETTAEKLVKVRFP